MAILCDYHMHTSFSEDSDAPMEEMIRAAMDRGLTAICVTEHMDLDMPGPEGYFQADLEAYVPQLLELQKLYDPLIEVRLGLELGMQPQLPERYRAMTGVYPFDYLIASQHLVYGVDPYEPGVWEQYPEEEVLKRYFEELLDNLDRMVREGDFDTVAHLDYVVRYAPHKNEGYSYEAYAASIDPILDLVIHSGKSLEINTAGLFKGLGMFHPAPDVLARYYEMGGRRITIGSDAHAPGAIAACYDETARILKEIGFTSYTIFRERTPCELPL